MGSTNELITAYGDPNFSYERESLQHRWDSWYAAAVKPAVDAGFDGRFVVWAVTIFASLFLLRATPRKCGTLFAPIAGGLAAALATALVAAGAPFATYLLLPRSLIDMREGIRVATMQYGPALPMVVGAAIGLTLLGGGGQSVRRLVGDWRFTVRRRFDARK
jgi:hypothetical protein